METEQTDTNELRPLHTFLCPQISGAVPPPQFYSEREKFQLHRQQQLQNHQQQMEIQQLQRQAQHRPGPSHLTLGPRGHPTPGVSKHGYANVAAAEEAAASLRSDGLPAKRTRTEDDYFNADSDEEEERKKKGGDAEALPYMPAPGSPGAKNEEEQKGWLGLLLFSFLPKSQ